MASWLGKIFRTGTPEQGAMPTDAARALSGNATTVAAPAKSAEEVRHVATGQLQRRPLLHRSGHLAGFEISLTVPAGMTPASGGPLDALMDGMVSTAESGRVALAIVPTEALTSLTASHRVKPGMMFALADPTHRAPDEGALIKTLRAQGGLLGSLGLPRVGASFVVLDATSLSLEALLERAQACRKVAPGCQLIATGLRTIDDMEAAIRGPFEMATGLFDRVGERRESGTLSPNVQRLCRLINRAMNEPDTRLLGEEIRTDVDLTYRLLRYANSPLLGLKRQVDSVDQALQILGRQALFRWLTILLVASTQGRSTSVALQEIALTRAHFLESLAPEIWAPSATLYTIGLLSLLDVMMQEPMEELLRPLGLSEEAQSALVHRSGPWHDLLELARSLETGQVQTARELSQDIGGLAAAEAAMERAWQASAAMSAELRDGDRKAGQV